MRPKERRDSGQNDFFRRGPTRSSTWTTRWRELGRAIDWRFLGAVRRGPSDKAGHPRRRRG
jgi:hypothetical protein